MRPIDADALKETVHRQHYRLSNAINTTDHGMFTIGIDQAIDEQPTIDAVPVVRCKDCWNATKMGGFMGEVLYCPILERNTDDECFCSYGERKDGEGNG